MPNQTALDAYIRVIAPSLSAALVSPAALAHVDAIARLLPPATGVVFECRLGAAASPVDLIVMYQPPDGGREILTADQPNFSLPAPLRADPVWGQVGAFCLDWATPTAPLHQPVNDIWLEFDVDGPPPPVPIPGFFATFQTPSLDAFGAYVVKQGETLPIIEQVLQSLQLGQPASGIRQTMLRCIEALPPSAWVFSVGLMFSRSIDFVRLCISEIPKGQTLAYLQAVGWPGDAAAVAATMNQLFPLLDRVALALDVRATVAPKVGFECYLNELNPKKEPRWHQLLDQLVAMGHCTPAKRDALLAWFGYIDARAYGDQWPANLRRAASFLGPGVRSLFARQVNHVKLVFHPDGRVEPKAYLAVKHVFAEKMATGGKS